MRVCDVRVALAGALACAVLVVGCHRRAPRPAQQAPAQPDQQAGAGQQAVPAQPAQQAPAFGNLYGETGGEEVLPAAQAPPGSPLRARKGDTFYRLSNARAEPVGRKPFPALLVDYEVLAEGPYNGVSLVYKRGDGPEKTYLLAFPLRRKGTIEVNLPFGTPRYPVVPKDAEVYLTRGEHRYGGGFFPTFKVSTSAVIGQMQLTRARDWTAEEAAKLSQPPPEGPKAGANATAGEDTPFAGDTTGGGSFRYAEPGKPVLGVEYGTGEWDGEPCLGALIPVYEEKQPAIPAAHRVMARPGYAVGGVTVRTKRYVNAVRVTFMKLTADGKLDPKDSYTTDWLGATQVAGREVSLGGDGRLVIGLHSKKGAILNGLALVMEGPAGR